MWRIALTNSSSVVEARLKNDQIGASGATFSGASGKHLTNPIAADPEVEHTVGLDIGGLVPLTQARHKTSALRVASPVNGAAAGDDNSLGYDDCSIMNSVEPQMVAKAA